MTLYEEKEKFVKVTKLILKQKLSKNEGKLNEYKNKIIKAYNDINKYCQENYTKSTEEEKQIFLITTDYVERKFEQCLIELNCHFELSEEQFAFADPEFIILEYKPPLDTEDNQESSDSEEDSDTGNEEGSGPSTSHEDLNTEREDTEDSYYEVKESDTEIEEENDNRKSVEVGIIDTKSPNQPRNIPDQEIKIEMEAPEFLKMTSSHINKTYSGDPLSLQSFIDSTQLLQSLATTPALKTFLVAFLKTKIDGRAREYILDTDNSVEAITARLQSNIKPDNSKVIEGRMLSLKLTNSTQDEFATKAENLAEALRRSLVIEGMSPAKATEISVDKTIELCRANVRSDLVKSVIEAAKFDTPKDVIAKTLTQLIMTKIDKTVIIIEDEAEVGTAIKDRIDPIVKITIIMGTTFELFPEKIRETRRHPDNWARGTRTINSNNKYKTDIDD